MPPIFYSYQPASAHLKRRKRLRDLGLFGRNTLHFSTPDAFNDPFDVRPTITANPDWRPSHAQLVASADRFMRGASPEDKAAAVAARMALYEDIEYRKARCIELERRLLEDFRGTSIACFT